MWAVNRARHWNPFPISLYPLCIGLCVFCIYCIWANVFRSIWTLFIWFDSVDGIFNTCLKNYATIQSWHIHNLQFTYRFIILIFLCKYISEYHNIVSYHISHYSAIIRKMVRRSKSISVHENFSIHFVCFQVGINQTTNRKGKKRKENIENVDTNTYRQKRWLRQPG